MEAILVHDGPGDGIWNMAMDQALLEFGSHSKIAIIRLYQWREPTLSLGYFQNYVQRQSHPASCSIACVRRKTGGGAIVHDQDVTYSIVMPEQRNIKGHAERLYRKTHSRIVVWLRESGWDAALAEDCKSNPSLSSIPAHEPFLCFNRRTALDIIVSGQKIAGSAQRRHNGALLQHGSLLWSRSRFAPELDGVYDLRRLFPSHQYSKEPSICQQEWPNDKVSRQSRLDKLEQGLATILCDELQIAFAITRFARELPSVVFDRASEMCQQQFGIDAWNQKC